MTTNKAAKQYMRNVRRYLVCSKTSRAHIMKIVQNGVNAYLMDDPEANYTGLVHALGEPKIFAESLLEIVPATDIKSVQRMRYFRSRTIGAALVVIVALALLLLGRFYLKYQNAMRGDFIINEVLAPVPEDMSMEEFLQYMDEIDRKWLGGTNK